jgi:vacuolar-type H+-ATPase subunit H
MARTQGSTKLDATTQAARLIIDAEAKARVVKTNHLKKARLAKELADGILPSLPKCQR